MVNINNKSWDKVRGSDILKLLANADDENFFFEFKADDVSKEKLVEEISAFSNTYGGYILLGIKDDKSIGGCTKWTEQRIHTVIHDCMTPVPTFDVRRFKIQGHTVFVIKIEEGAMPPYITNKGQIFERISSGSFKIKESSKLTQLYNKRKDQLEKLRRKIELPSVQVDTTVPSNFCGYVDLGFDMVCSQPTNLQKDFYHFDLQPVTEYLRSETPEYSVTRVGRSVLISIGQLNATDNHGNPRPMHAGLHNYMEIMWDGSVRCRVILTRHSTTNTTNISNIPYLLYHVFQDIYRMIMGDELAKHFIYAQKYEALTVLQQFVPDYMFREDAEEETVSYYGRLLSAHCNKYGNNLIVESNRIPKNDYELIDRRLFDSMGVKYSADMLFKELFMSEHTNLGFIDNE